MAYGHCNLPPRTHIFSVAVQIYFSICQLILLQITTLLGWSVTIVLAMLLVYGPHKSILPGAEEWNGAEKVIFGTFRRFLWGLVLVWVVYACHYGAGGLYVVYFTRRHGSKFHFPYLGVTLPSSTFQDIKTLGQFSVCTWCS